MKFRAITTLFVSTIITLPFAASVHAQSHAIDFDDLDSVTVVTDQYNGMTFSSDTGHENVTVLSESAASAPNILCTRAIGGFLNCDRATIIDFDPPVTGLSFDCIGINSTGSICKLEVQHAGGTKLSKINASGGVSKMTVHLEEYLNVTRVRLYSISDPYGLGWDNFRFDSIAAYTKSYGVGVSGTDKIPGLYSNHDPIIGKAFDLVIENSRPGSTPGILVLGTQSAAVQSDFVGVLLVQPAVVVSIAVPTGEVVLNASIRNSPALATSSVYLQTILIDGGAPKGYAFSRGLRVFMGY